MKIRPVEAVFI